MWARVGLGVLLAVQGAAAECQWEGNNDYTRYTPGNEVKLHADTTKKMPDTGSESDWENWGIQLVIPVAILFCCCGVCMGCFLCRYNCKVCKRLDAPGFMIPSSKWAQGGSRRTCGWVSLALVLFVTTFVLSYGMTQRNKFVKTIRDIPDVLTVYSDFIRTDVIPELYCIGNETTTVINATNALRTCSNVNLPQYDNIINSANSIIQNNGIDGAVRLFSDLAHDIDDVARRARLDQEADETRSVISWFVGLAAVVVAVNFVLGYCAAKRESWKARFQVICCASESMCGCFFAFVFVVCVSLIVLRATASFCIDPDRLLAEIDEANLDARARYYLVCDAWSQQEQDEKFPWIAEKNATNQAYNQMLASAATINPGANCQPAYTNLTRSVAALRDDFTNTTGLFGERGPLGCSLTARFIEQIYILLCDTLYVPLDRMVWCLAVGAACMAFLTFINTCLRVEGEGNHQRFDNLNPAFTPEMHVVRQPGEEWKPHDGGVGGATALNPVVDYPPAYQDPGPLQDEPSINVVQGHAQMESSPYEDDAGETIA